MKIIINGFENEIICSKEYVNVLQISNKSLFQNVIGYIYDGVSGYIETSEIELLSDDGDVLNFEDEVYLMSDFYNLEINTKKIVNKIQDKILKEFEQEKADEVEKYINSIRHVVRNELNEFPLELSMKEEIRLNDILKLFNIQIDIMEINNVQQRIEAVIDILANLHIAQILVLPNIKCYMDNIQLVEIYKYALYNGVSILIIESNTYEKIKYEKIFVIDEDFNDYYI